MLDGSTRLRNGTEEIYHFNGLSTFGEYAVVPEDSLVKIREDAPLDRVALIGWAFLLESVLSSIPPR
ncbi:MAG: hypothetical protein Ct9H300mP11_30130 [Chloroflexota bacterium]|nr:MAG: hypothetical protein Ct9H300mP11_30130 [Chloroflexota bacterium]